LRHLKKNLKNWNYSFMIFFFFPFAFDVTLMLPSSLLCVHVWDDNLKTYQPGSDGLIGW